MKDVGCLLEMKLENTCCFTGHRPDKLNGYDPKDNKELLLHLRDIIEYHINTYKVDTFITGMALGIDQWAGRIVLKLKEKYPHIKLIAAVPCDNHSGKWNDKSRKQWQAIIDSCDYVYYVSTEPYTHWCMQKRNEWMVDNSKYVIAVHDGSKGGTGNCLNYAINKYRYIVSIHPKTLEVGLNKN